MACLSERARGIAAATGTVGGGAGITAVGTTDTKAGVKDMDAVTETGRGMAGIEAARAEASVKADTTDTTAAVSITAVADTMVEAGITVVVDITEAVGVTVEADANRDQSLEQ